MNKSIFFVSHLLAKIIRQASGVKYFTFIYVKGIPNKYS
ncbi:MAG: hypothetical protein K0S09_1762 [Sphingobacteriaceae bacterium]|jgi:hypothetical protein|nr:hypothetical protein [Sphingobacteriaceae bacterium]